MQLQLYPRGFLGASSINAEEFKSTPINTTRQGHYFTLSFFEEKKDKLKGNPVVNDSYRSLIAGDRRVRGFQFSEKLYKTAFALFSCKNFIDWILLQEKSPLFSHIQRDFIIDTVNFINNGKRSISIMTWLSIINHATYQETSGYRFNKEDLREIDNIRGGNSMSDVISLWLSHSDGLVDFITTLYILFGDTNVG